QFQVAERGDPLMTPERSAAEIAALDARVGQLAATLDHGTVIPLNLAVDAKQPVRPDPFSGPSRMAMALLHQIPGRDHATLVPLYVASPQLLAAVGVDPGALDTHEFQTAVAGADFTLFVTKGERTPIGDLSKNPPSDYSS